VDDFLPTTLAKFGSVFSAIAIFFVVLGTIFFIAGKFNGKKSRYIAIVVFVAPALILLMAGLVIPAIRTVMFSFMDPDSLKFIGFDNYTWMFKDPNVAIIMRNTLLWLLVTPIFTTALGLLLAVMLDRIKRE